MTPRRARQWTSAETLRPADRGAPAAGASVRTAARSDPEPPVSPFAASIAIVSLAFLVAGIAWPHSAETLLRTLLAVLALGFVVARAYRAELPERTTHDLYSPFERPAAARTSPAAPRALRRLTEKLGAADDGQVARRTAIPWSVARTIVQEASRRLAERHGLRLGEPTHHPRIRSLVSEPTWLLIGPGDPGANPGTGPPAGSRPVPLSRLDLILDDLERL